MKTSILKHLVLAVVLIILATASLHAETADTPAGANAPTLVQALVCKQVEELAPKGAAVVFRLELGEVACFTAFDPVPAETVIYHHWFFRDRPSARIRLRVKPPRWSSFSRIQLRPGDAGPWRVEIVDMDGRRLGLVRFSVVE
jgi:hypothetical protein